MCYCKKHILQIITNIVCSLSTIDDANIINVDSFLTSSTFESENSVRKSPIARRCIVFPTGFMLSEYIGSLSSTA